MHCARGKEVWNLSRELGDVCCVEMVYSLYRLCAVRRMVELYSDATPAFAVALPY